MKLAVLGGGGYRTPLLMKSVALRCAALGITEAALMDTDETKLKRYGALARAVAGRLCPELSVSLTGSAAEAMRGADFIITTIRAEADDGRVFDERAALSRGVLGQETTGAGGFAMALRSIAVLSEDARLALRVASPGFVMLNFTNPSGLVTEALRRQGFDFVYGVCDAPSGFIRQLSALAGPGCFSARCQGLNHLSFFSDFRLDGRDVSARLLADPRLWTDTELRVFDPALVGTLSGFLPNEYLYFYYYRAKAVRSLLAGGKTRGEAIREINRRMDAELAGIDPEREPERAFAIYHHFYNARENSYFSLESGVKRRPLPEDNALESFLASPDRGGYAGVALDFISAYTGRGDVEMVLSVPGGGAVEGLRADDVAEITCRVDRTGAHPLPAGRPLPPEQLALVQSVKAYERLTADAVLSRDRVGAAAALTAHPLVGDWETARALADLYIDRYAAYCGAWK